MPYWFDGNNLIGHSAERAGSDSLTRRAFLRHLEVVVRSRGGRFLVFFDGDDVERAAPPRGIRIRYCAPRSADEEIVHRLAGEKRPSEVIVVTNDLGLRRRCRDAGAQTRSWAEFESLPVRRDRSGYQEPAESVDIEQWRRYFGLHDDELG